MEFLPVVLMHIENPFFFFAFSLSSSLSRTFSARASNESNAVLHCGLVTRTMPQARTHT